MISRPISTPVMSLRAALFGGLAAALLAGCSSIPLGSEVPVETRTPGALGADGSGGAGASGTSQSRVTPVDLPGGNAADAGKLMRVIYFDFDSYAVKDDYRPTIDGYAKLLGSDRKKHLQVEGYTDDRGGSEYNLALGQKRAEAVAKSLALLGATDSQVEAVSFGKERPAVQGSDEEARAKNRRAELNLR
jgi:peptidoglycan-associated lipoprotein